MTLPATSAPASAKRLHYVDGLRGLAALAVALLHIHATSPARPFMPAPIAVVLEHGHLGVAIFFVLSGFVIARSVEGMRITPASYGRFMARRLVRLHPPYVASILLALVVVTTSNLLLRDRVHALPSAEVLVAHFFYLEDILRVPKLNDVYWTLCLEIQFYLLFVLLLGLVRRKSRGARLLAFGPVTIYGLALVAGAPVREPAGACFSSWPLFFGGVLTCWCIHGGISRTVLALYATLLAAIGLARSDGMTFTAVATIGVLAFCDARPTARFWLEGRVLQYLGAISYSLYLVHPFFGQRLANLGVRLIGTSPFASWTLFLAAITFAILGAHLFWRFIEMPCVGWSHRIRLRERGAGAAPVMAPAVDGRG